jgi:hypothetical protein
MSEARLAHVPPPVDAGAGGGSGWQVLQDSG